MLLFRVMLKVSGKFIHSVRVRVSGGQPGQKIHFHFVKCGNVRHAPEVKLQQMLDTIATSEKTFHI